MTGWIRLAHSAEKVTGYDHTNFKDLYTIRIKRRAWEVAAGAKYPSNHVAFISFITSLTTRHQHSIFWMMLNCSSLLQLPPNYLKTFFADGSFLQCTNISPMSCITALSTVSSPVLGLLHGFITTTSFPVCSTLCFDVLFNFTHFHQSKTNSCKHNLQQSDSDSSSHLIV